MKVVACGMWHSSIVTKYGRDGDVNGWNAKIGERILSTCPWKNISRLYPRFIPFTRYDVGRGDRIKFWEDKLWAEDVLASKFPRIYSISSNKGLPISCFYSSSSPTSNLA